MKTYRSISLIVMTCFAIALNGMEQQNNQKELMPSDHPALKADPKGTCYLKMLPEEVLNLIAEYLIFKEEETDADFSERISYVKVTKTIEELKEIQTKYGKFYISSMGSLKLQHNTSTDQNDNSVSSFLSQSSVSEENIIQVPRDTFGRRTGLNIFANVKNMYQSELQVTDIAASKTKSQIAVITKTTNDITDDSKLVKISSIETKTKIRQDIHIGQIPQEYLEVQSTKPNEILALGNKGYSYCGVTSGVHGSFAMLKNPISFMAISSDGKKVAIANNSHIFLGSVEFLEE